MPIVRSLIENDRVNAALAWPIVSAIVVASAATAWQDSILWAALGVGIVGLALVPPAVRRDTSSMPPGKCC